MWRGVPPLGAGWRFAPQLAILWGTGASSPAVPGVPPGTASRIAVSRGSRPQPKPGRVKEVAEVWNWQNGGQIKAKV